MDGRAEEENGPSSGTKLGSYEVVAPLGAGGMGEVEPSCGRQPAGEILSEVSEGSAC